MMYAQKNPDPNGKQMKEFLACLDLQMNIIRTQRGLNSNVPPNTGVTPSISILAPASPTPVPSPTRPMTPTQIPATPPPIVNPPTQAVIQARNTLCDQATSENVLVMGRSREVAPGCQTPSSSKAPTQRASPPKIDPVKTPSRSKTSLRVSTPKTPRTPASLPITSSPTTPSAPGSRLFRACRLMSPASTLVL